MGFAELAEFSGLPDTEDFTLCIELQLKTRAEHTIRMKHRDKRSRQKNISTIVQINTVTAVEPNRP